VFLERPAANRQLLPCLKFSRPAIETAAAIALMALRPKGQSRSANPRPLMQIKQSSVLRPWLVAHRELNTSRRVRVVFDLLAEELGPPVPNKGPGHITNMTRSSVIIPTVPVRCSRLLILAQREETMAAKKILMITKTSSRLRGHGAVPGPAHGRP
jgi:hypothetical protein